MSESPQDSLLPDAPPEGVEPDDEGDDSSPAGLRRFFVEVARALGERPGEAALTFLALLVETAFTAAVPMSFKYLADHVIASRDATALGRMLAGLGVGVVLAAVVGMARDRLYARFTARMLNGLRVRMFRQLTRLSMDYHARTQASDVLTRFSTDVASVEQAVAAAPAWGIVPALDSLASTALLFALDARLALVALLVYPACLVGPRLVGPRASAAGYRRKLDESAAIHSVHENVTAQPVVKAFGLEGLVLGRFERRLARLERSSVSMGFLGALLERSSGVGTLVLQVVVLGVGATLAFRGQLSVGSLAAFLTLFLTLSTSIGYLSQYFPYLLQASAGMRRIDELLDEQPRVADAPGAKELPRLAREIRFDAVGFGYTEGRSNLDGVSLTVRAGESVAFVGPSGSGKSTVLNLLMRFYDPGSGAVTFDGTSLRDVTQASLRAQLGVVFQDSVLFDASVRDNIRLGKPTATDAEVEAAARAAEIHDIILSMPDGYDTRVGERGGRLSGGQRQRVAIARAILRDPGVLLLDEATSALDAGTEAAINATLERVAKGRTLISVSHRLASVVTMDRIYVLDGGRLVESGTHRELLEGNGLYAELWRKQTGVTVRDGGSRAAVQGGRLRAIRAFQALDDAQLEAVADQFRTEHVPAGREVFRQGDPGDRLYLIARGRVEVSVGAEGARAAATLADGDTFGEIALLEDSPRTATVRTRTDCVFLTLPRDAFLALLERSPTLRDTFERITEARLAANASPAVDAAS